MPWQRSIPLALVLGAIVLISGCARRARKEAQREDEYDGW